MDLGCPREQSLVTPSASSLTGYNQISATTDPVSSMVELLHRELELQPLLDLYFSHAEQTLPVQAVKFSAHGEIWRSGISSHDAIRTPFVLSVPGQSQISISYYGDKPLTPNEFLKIQELHRALRFPLQNALRFHKAVQDSAKDPLTGLGNRRAYSQQGKKALYQARRLHIPVTLMLIDLDRFKQLNDAAGHAAGDHVLIHAGQCFSDAIRNSDYAFRLGGDEFAILLFNASQNTAASIASRIQASFEQHELARQYNCSLSMGSAQLQVNESLEQLFERTDKALYQAKSAGRNQLCQG